MPIIKHYFLGICKNDKWSRLQKGEKSYWCVYKANKAKVGDYIVLYRVGIGINQIYRIINDSQNEIQTDCQFRQMITVSIELIYSLSQPITSKEIKGNSVLDKSKPAKRNFQGTIFSLTKNEWDETIRLIKIKSLTAAIEGLED